MKFKTNQEKLKPWNNDNNHLDTIKNLGENKNFKNRALKQEMEEKAKETQERNLPEKELKVENFDEKK